MKSLRFALPLLIFAGLGVLLYFGLHNDPRYVPSPLIDKPAPEFTLPELRDTTQTVSRAGLLGKPYLLNVWGSWCVACQQEHPVLMQYARLQSLPLIGLNWKDDPEDAKRWLRRFGDPYAAIALDVQGRVGIDFGVYGAPETFLIDGQGTIRWKHVGPITPEVIRDEIEPLAARLRGP